MLSILALINLLGCQTMSQKLPKSNFQFYIEKDANASNEIWSATATMPISQLKFNICPHPILSTEDIASAHITTSNFGKCILFQVTQRAMVELYRLSIEATGRKIVFAFNGQVLGISTSMNDVIEDGRFAIFPEIEEENLEALIIDINDTITKLKKLKKD